MLSIINSVHGLKIGLHRSGRWFPRMAFMTPLGVCRTAMRVSIHQNVFQLRYAGQNIQNLVYRAAFFDRCKVSSGKCPGTVTKAIV